MAIAIKPAHFKRYKDIASLLMKHGRGDLVRQINAFDSTEIEPDNPEVTADAASFADDLEKLGPTFVKLGQLLSTRPDMLPIAYTQALSRLQDKLEPFSFAEVESTINQELGVRISKAFAEFDATPVGSASLGQVHRATLRDGRLVVVKVQRPGIREVVANDLEVLEELAGLLERHTQWGERYELERTLEEFRRSIWRELDYRQEARNLATLAENLEPFEKIVVPVPIDDFTTSRVLTMEYIKGVKITDISPLTALELDGSGLADELFRAYLQQILVDGFFHADPHPGNVFLTSDHRIALLDLGMVGYVAPELQENLLQMILAVSDGRGDDAATLSIKISNPREDFDEPSFRQNVSALVSEHHRARLEELQAGTIVLEITRIAGESRLRVPAELTMLGKALLNLDLIARTLDPSFDPNSTIRRDANRLLQQRLWKSLSQASVFGGMLELKDLIMRLPGRVNRILDSAASNGIRVKVDAIDEDLLIEGLQKIANRITLGLVLAALIVGAALLMRVETQFRILGYPGFAILCFIVAAGSGLALILSIVLHDRRVRK